MKDDSNCENNAIILKTNPDNQDAIESIENKPKPTSEIERSSIRDIILSNHIIGIDR